MRRWVPIVALLALAWCGREVLRGRSADTPVADRIGEPAGAAPRASRPPWLAGRSAAIPAASRSAGDTVAITGTVIDRDSAEPIGHVEVVVRSAGGEESTMAAADGTYRLDVPAGAYRIYVRDDLVLSLGMAGREYIPDTDASDVVGVPDEAVMPLVLAHDDLTGVDLAVVRGGIVEGKVLDAAGRPVARAVVRARNDGGAKAVLGDVAETDATGAFELVVPPGGYILEATHARYAGVVNHEYLEVTSGEHHEATLTLATGCVVRGRVVRPDGSPAGEGAIELQQEAFEGEPPLFGAATRIAADGTFRWYTTEELAVTLRAWPWKSPPSQPRTFACKEGARFEDVVFQLPAKGADIEGLLVDASGTPMPNALLHITPLGDAGIPQIERTDADGRWGVFAMPAGEYEVTARVPGHGVVRQTVTAPVANVRLALGGVGRLEGTTPLLATGSFELELGACDDIDGGTVEHRLVAVRDGRFTVDDVPACGLALLASWRDTTADAYVEVKPGQTATVELGIGPRPTKRVTGTVRDAEGRPVAGARVRVMFSDEERGTVTDATGRYELEAHAGDEVQAMTDTAYADAMLPSTPAPREVLDFVLQPLPDDIY